jgi:disulfide oxidoreductase YuzD
LLKKKNKIKWFKEPEEHNFPAAKSYLSLLYNEDIVNEKIDDLKTSNEVKFKAKDIFRASGLSLLGVSNSHVEKDIKKIKNGDKLSPILLVRDEMTPKVIIADGYHRLCAAYTFDEDMWIPCRMV